MQTILDQIKEIHERKNQDYAQSTDPFSNFKRSAVVTEWFNDKVDKSFVNLIGVKLARLAELRNGKEPKNESVQDSFLDLCTYCCLWYAYYLNQMNVNERVDFELNKPTHTLCVVHSWKITTEGKFCTQCGITYKQSLYNSPD